MVRKAWIGAILLAFLAIPAMAQTEQAPVNQGQFSLTANAVALPGGRETVAGTLLGETYAVTPEWSLRGTELLAPGNDTNAYLGGFQYFPSFLAKEIAKTNLKGVVPYFTASIGVDMYSPANEPTQQHISVLAGGGANYCPASGLCVNLAEVQFARLPGSAGSTAIVSSGLTLKF